MTEQKEFVKSKKQLIKKLGKNALYDGQIMEEGQILFGNKFIGVFSQDTIPLHKIGYMIFNVDTSKQTGSHWVACYSTNKCLYIYDSFGRHSERLLPILTNKLHRKNIHFKDSRHDAEQYGDTQVCGQLSLAWLCVVKSMGIRKALKI